MTEQIERVEAALRKYCKQWEIEQGIRPENVDVFFSELTQAAIEAANGYQEGFQLVQVHEMKGHNRAILPLDYAEVVIRDGGRVVYAGNLPITKDIGAYISAPPATEKEDGE